MGAKVIKPVITEVCVTREEDDCAVVAMSNYLGLSYEEVLRATAVTDRKQGRNGLWAKTMVRIASRLGRTLVIRKLTTLNAHGILKTPTHAAVLIPGYVINNDGSIWKAKDYLASEKLNHIDCDLLVAVED